MDRGTKIRTFLAVLAVINQAIAMTEIPDFGNDYANMAYKVITYVISVTVLAANTWYNNDYTEEALMYTGMMRQAKLEQSDDYEGERFLSDIFEEEEKDE